jgi:hypothetical protein
MNDPLFGRAAVLGAPVSSDPGASHNQVWLQGGAAGGSVIKRTQSPFIIFTKSITRTYITSPAGTPTV